MKKLGFMLLAVAGIFLMVSVALADVAVSVNNTRKGNCVRLDFPAGTTATRDPQDVSMHIGFAKMTINGVRDSTTTGYEYFDTISGNITGVNTGASDNAKTYGLYINMTRQVGADTLIGDIDDSAIKVRIRNNAASNTAGNTLRGIDIQARNGATGFETNLEGGLISLQTDSQSTTGSVTNARALRVETTLNGQVTAVHIPLDVRAFRQSANIPTIECVERLVNGNTTGTGITGLRFESESGTPAYFTTCIDMSNANVTATGSDLKMSNAVRVYSGTATTRAAVRALVGDSAPRGSLFIGVSGGNTTKPNMYIKVLAANGDTDWERIVTQAAD